MSLVAQIVDDAQTGITSLGSAIAGSASNELGSMLIRAAGIGSGQSLGDVGVRFVVRALVSSAAFSAAATLMPASSNNVFFSIVFFAANDMLVRDAVAIGNIIVRGVLRQTPAIPFAPDQGQSPAHGMPKSSSCACK